MERCINIIPRKCFHPLDLALVCMYLAVELVFVGYAGGLQSRESQNFRCHSTDKVASKEIFVQTECFRKYDQSYSPFLPLYQFVLVTFSAVTTVCVVYGFYVKSRVEEIVTITNFNAEDPRPNLVVRTRLVSTCHLLHLFLRFLLTVLSAVLQKEVLLHLHEFPSEFDCIWPLRSNPSIAYPDTTYHRSNHTSVVCTNVVASEKTSLVKGIFFANIGFAIVACVEGIYILFRVWLSKPDYDFLYDSKFCRLYLLNKPSVPAGLREFEEIRMGEIANETETVQPLFPPSLGEDGENRALDDIYVPLVICTGRAEPKHKCESKTTIKLMNHGQVDEYQKFSDESIPIENLQDLFLSNKDTNDKDPRTILVVGRPGIGKSLLCSKILHDWSKRRILHDATKSFKYVFLFQFRWFNAEGTQTTSLFQLLHQQIPSSAPPDFFQHLLNNPKEILIIFDGLDELKTLGNCTAEERKEGNGYADLMPISALFIKLVYGKLLGGATVLTTTRATGVNSFRGLTFDRNAEIVGFTPQRIEEYVKKFCNQVAETTDKVWNWIKGSRDLLNLCYVPANCSIVCFILKMCTELNKSASDSFNLPTTLTELYQYAVRIFLLKHNPLYHGSCISMDEIQSDDCLQGMQDTLNRLKELAHKGMKEKRLIFDLKDVEGMENCGLLHKLPGTYKSKFYFFHFTMQEFLAAKYIVTSEEEGTLISSKVPDQDWDLVIQFVAGLLRNHYERGKNFIEQFAQKLLPSFRQENLYVDDNQVLMMKCLYELQNGHIFDEVAREVQKYITSSTFCLRGEFGPSNYIAFFYFLKQLKSFQHLGIHDYIGVSEYTCLELGNLLKDKCPKKLALNRWVSDKGLDNLLKPMLQNTSNLRHPGTVDTSITRSNNQSQQQSTVAHKQYNLTEFDLSFNNITAEGVAYLGHILTSEWFKVSELYLIGNKINSDSVLELQKSITHQNCELTYLNISRNRISDEGVRFLSEALTQANCKLTKLDISHNKVSNEGACVLGNALKHENCKLTELDTRKNNISDAGARFLGKALTHENCKLTKLDIKDNNISNEGICIFGNALTHENCKLTELNISYTLSDVGACILSNAFTHENCKLVSLDLFFNYVSNVDAVIGSNASTQKNWKLVKRGITYNNIAVSDEGASSLGSGLTHENSKLTSLGISLTSISLVALRTLGNALKHGHCKRNFTSITYGRLSNENIRNIDNAFFRDIALPIPVE